MAVLGDDLEAVEVCSHLTNVVDHAGNTEQGRVPAVVLDQWQLDVATFYICLIHILGESEVNAYILI